MQATDEFGARLKRIREAAGLTQEEVGDRCGMDLSAISRLERGERNPRLTTMLRLADALDVEPAVFVQGMRWDESDSVHAKT